MEKLRLTQEEIDKIIEHLSNKLTTCNNYSKFRFTGGVAANSRLRAKLSALCEKEGVELYRPSPALCTDNGAMVACSAYYKYKS